MLTVSNLFQPRPGSWGLRGDGPLWYEMETAFAHTPLPDNRLLLYDLLCHQFTRSVGSAPMLGKDVYVERFDRGGMSHGMVCGDWWLKNGIPLLLNRFDQAKAGKTL